MHVVQVYGIVALEHPATVIAVQAGL